MTDGFIIAYLAFCTFLFTVVMVMCETEREQKASDVWWNFVMCFVPILNCAIAGIIVHGIYEDVVKKSVDKKDDVV